MRGRGISRALQGWKGNELLWTLCGGGGLGGAGWRELWLLVLFGFGG